MTPEWTSEIEERFTELRLREMGGQLTAVEQAELAELYAQIEAETENTHAILIQRLEQEQGDLEQLLAKEQARNQELMTLFNQQALLIAANQF